MSNKLKAVNRALRVIGETPVNTLNSGVPDAEIALTILEETTEEVLETGWHCNTSYGVRLVPDVSNEIRVPDSYLSVDSSGPSKGFDVTIREDVDGGIKLFDVKGETFKFTAPVTVDVIYNFDFDGLPRPLQAYISARAARVFQEQQLGSVSLDNFTTRAEAQALAALQDYEADVEDSNVLTDSAYMCYVRYRNSPISFR